MSTKTQISPIKDRRPISLSFTRQPFPLQLLLNMPKDMSEKSSHTVSPRAGRCLAADCVSVHYDVHICIRTCGHVIITYCAAAVPVKFAWTLIREGAHRHRCEAPKSVSSTPKFSSCFASHHVLRWCTVISAFWTVKIDLR